MRQALEAANIGTDREPYNPITQHVNVSGYDIGSSNYQSAPSKNSSGYGGFLSGLGGMAMLGLTLISKPLSASAAGAKMGLDLAQSGISAVRQVGNNLNWRSKSNWWDNNAKSVDWNDGDASMSQWWDNLNLMGGVKIPTLLGEIDVGSMIGQESGEFYTYGRILHDEDWLQDIGSITQLTLPVGRAGSLFGKEWEDWHWDVTPSFLVAAPFDIAGDPLVWMTGGTSLIATPIRALAKGGQQAVQGVGVKLTRQVIEEAVEKTIRNRIGAAVGMSASDAAAMSGTAIKSQMDEIVNRVMRVAEEATHVARTATGKAAKSSKARAEGFKEMADRVDEVIAKELEDLFQTLGGSYGVQVAKGPQGLGHQLANLFEVGADIIANPAKGLFGVSTIQAREIAKIFKKLKLNASGQTLAEFKSATAGAGKTLIGKEAREFTLLFDDAAVTRLWTKMTRGGRNAARGNIDDMSLSLGIRIPLTGGIGRAAARRIPVLKNAKWPHTGRPIGINVLGGSKVARDAAVSGIPRGLRYVFSDVIARAGIRVTRGKMRGRFGSQDMGVSTAGAKARIDAAIAKGTSAAKAQRVEIQSLKDMIRNPALDAGLRMGAKQVILDMQRGNSMMHRARAIFIRKSASTGEGFRQDALEHFGMNATPEQIRMYGEAISEAAELLGEGLKAGAKFTPEQMIATSKGIEVSAETANRALAFFKEVRAEAHAMAGMEFIPEREFYVFRMVGEDAQDYIEFAAREGRGVKLDASGIEKARLYGSPDDVADAARKAGLSPDEYAKGKGAMRDDFLGEKLYNPNEVGVSIPDQINEIMIRHYGKATGEGVPFVPQVYNRDIFDMMNRYSEIISKRVGEVHTEVLLRSDRVFTDKWITQLHIPSDAVLKAANVVKQRQVAINEARKRLMQAMREEMSSTAASRKMDWAAVENQAKVSDHLQGLRDDAVDAGTEIWAKKNAARIRFEEGEVQVKQLSDDVAAIEAQIKAIGDKPMSRTAAKKELKRIAGLEKQKQDVLDEIKRLELGGADDVSALNAGTIYGALWEEARTAVATKVWLEKNIVEAFGDMDTAKAFAAWYAKEWDATAKRLGPQTVTGESGLEATNRAVADAMQDSVFTHPRAQGEPFTIQARDGRLFFERLSHQFDNNSIGEWVAFADPERFMMPAVPTGKYAGASHAVFEALDFLDGEVTRTVRRLEELTAKYTKEVPEFSAALEARMPSKVTMTEEGQIIWAKEEVTRLQSTQPSEFTEAMKAEVAELNEYIKYLEGPETPAVIDRFAIPTPEALENAKKVIAEAFNHPSGAAAISSKEFDDAARMYLAVAGEKPILRVNDMGDVDALITAVKRSLVAREQALAGAIADTPLGDLRFRVGNSLTDETAEIGLSALVLLQRFRAQMQRGVRDGALPRTTTVNIEGLVAAVDDATTFAYKSEVTFNGKRYLMTEYDDFGEMAAETAADAVYREVNIPVRNSWGDVSSDGRKWRIQEVDELDNVSAFDPNADMLTWKIVYGEGGSAQVVPMDSKVGIGQTGVNAASRFERGLAADILLGNQDVVGLNLRHLGLTSDGRIVRLNVDKTFGNMADPPNLGARTPQESRVPANIRRMTDAELGQASDDAAEALSTGRYMQDVMDEDIARLREAGRQAREKGTTIQEEALDVGADGIFNHPKFVQRRMVLEQQLIDAEYEMAYRGLKWEGDYGWVRRDKTYDLETWSQREVARQGDPPEMVAAFEAGHRRAEQIQRVGIQEYKGSSAPEKFYSDLEIDDILDIQALVAGRPDRGFRTTEVRIQGGADVPTLAPPPAAEVPRLMEGLMASGLHTDDPVAFVHEFLKIHPFADGNGRTAAILLNHLSPAESGYKLLPDFFGTGFVGEPPIPIGPWGQRVTDASARGGYVEHVGPVEISINTLPQNLAEDFVAMGNLPRHQRVEVIWDFLGEPPAGIGDRAAAARTGLKRVNEITDEMSAEGILVTASVDEDATALRNLYAKAGFKEITHYDDSGMIFIAKFPEPVQIPHVLDDFAKLEGKGIAGVGQGEQFRKGVDDILAVRAKYGGWREMLAHALPVDAQSDEQIRRLALFLEDRTEQLAAIAERQYLSGTELAQQQAMQAAGGKGEWHVIRSESRGHGIGVEPTLDPTQISGRVGAAARGTDQAHFLEEGTQVLPWIDGSGINVTPQSMAYGGENVFDRSDFLRMVIDLDADASNIKLYGFQPADPNIVRARELLVQLGNENMTAATIVETLDELTNLMPRPYGHVSPYKEVSTQGRLASGIGEQTLDMLDRAGDDLLDEFIRFANPKGRKVIDEALDSAATARTVNAFNKTRAIMNNPELVVKFPAYNLSQQRGLMREVLEFVSWQESRYTRRLADDEGLGSLSDAIDRYFIHRNKDLNPNGYAEAVASAEAGAASHANELIGTVHLRYMQNQKLRAGMTWDEWLGLHGPIDSTAKLRAAVAAEKSFDPAVVRPFLARYPETSLIGRMWQQYHLSLAGDGYSATAWMNATDRWTMSPFVADGQNVVGRKGARAATVADDPLDEAGVAQWFEAHGMAEIDDLSDDAMRQAELDMVAAEETKGAAADLADVQRAQNDFYVNVTLTNPLGVRPRIFMDDMERLMTPDELAKTLDSPIEQHLVDAKSFESTYRQVAIDALIEDNGLGALTRKRVVAADALEKAVEKQKIVSDNLWLMEREWTAHLETVNRMTREVEGAKELLQFHEWAIERRNLFVKAMAKLQTMDPAFKFKQGGVNALSEAYQDLESTIRLLGMADLEESKFILQTLAEGGSYQAAIDDLLDVSGNAAKLRNLPEAVPLMDRAWRAGWRPIGVKSQGREALVESIIAADMYNARGGMGKFLGRGGYYDAVHNTWKGYAILSPGFWARNYMGGMFLNYLHGVDISSYTRFIRAYNALKIEQAVAQGKIRRAEGRRLLNKATGGKVSADDVSLVRQMEESGAFGQGQAGVEFTPSTGRRGVITVAGKQIDLMKFNPFSSRNVALKAGHKMNIKVETFLRGTIGFDTMKKGGTLGEAMDNIWRYHFDYDDLSRFERGVVKRIVPFYTWTRRSLPLVMEEFMMKPYKFHRYKMAVDAISEDDSSDFGVVPDWMVRQGAIPLGQKFAGEHMWMIPDLPMRGFYELINAPTRPDMSPMERIAAVGEAMSSMVTPLIKAPAEVMLNRNIWKGYSFDGSLEPVPEAFSWVPGLMPAMSAAGVAKKTPSGNWAMKDNWLHGMTQMVPTLSQARRLFPDEERYQHRLLSSWMSFLFGLGLRTNTSWEQQQELRARYYEQMDKQREMRDIYKIDAGIR